MIAVAGQSNAVGLAAPLAKALGEEVLDWSVPGATLLKIGPPGEWNWLDGAKAKMGDAKPDLVWWIQGESEALYGPVKESDYGQAMMKLRIIFDCPMMISPISAPHAVYPWSRPVLAAQYRLCIDFVAMGFVLGPEYYDLEHCSPAPPAEYGQHLTERGRLDFATRAADKLRSMQ